MLTKLSVLIWTDIGQSNQERSLWISKYTYLYIYKLYLYKRFFVEMQSVNLVVLVDLIQLTLNNTSGPIGNYDRPTERPTRKYKLYACTNVS